MFFLSEWVLFAVSFLTQTAGFGFVEAGRLALPQLGGVVEHTVCLDDFAFTRHRFRTKPFLFA